MITEHRVKIKILNEKGIDQANIRLSYLSAANSQSINSIEAQTYNLDATGNITTTKVEKKLIFDKKIDKFHSDQIFTFP